MLLRTASTLTAALLATAGLAACSAKSNDTVSGSSTSSATGSSGSSGSTSAASCAPASLHLHQAGKLTVATDSPAYDPWFEKNDPSNGHGFESAVAYAVAQKLGFAASDVQWVKQAFGTSYTPGAKAFDFDINEISITPERASAVTFSDGYYTAEQAVITLAKNKDKAQTLAGLKSLKLGAESATTSLTAIRDDVKPTQQPLVFDNDDAAKQALVNGQIDGLVTDLPSSDYMSSEIPKSVVVGKFENKAPELFGLLFEKGNPLVTCVDKALASLKADGTLAQLQQKWLAGMESVPTLK
jgi:polar amino acid transport system substrate-binding protein